MKMNLGRFFAAACFAATLGNVAIVGSVAHADWRDTSPSDSMHHRPVTTKSIIAPTATSEDASDSSVSCCDNQFSCCDSGGSCRPGLLSRLLGTKCDDGCCEDSGFSGCDDYGCDGLGRKCGLLGYGIIKPSDRCFDDFCAPVTNPVFFEDPRTLTHVRFLFLNHELPAALGGNSVQVYAAQIRLALSERLSLIATKDGLIYTKSELPGLDSGFADIAAGLKYNLYRDPCAGRIFSVGTTVEVPSGSRKSLQGNGGGEWNFFATGGTRIMGSTRAHWISTGGLRQPNNEFFENRLMYWSNHFDYRLNTAKPLFVFTEFHWWHYLQDGGAFGLPVHGGDIFNLGSVGVTGDNLVTQAVGGRYIHSRTVSLGGAFEFPLTELKGLMENRMTFDLIVQY